MEGNGAQLRWVVDLATGEVGFAVIDPDGEFEEWWLSRKEVYEMAVKILACHLALSINNNDPEVGRLE